MDTLLKDLRLTPRERAELSWERIENSMIGDHMVVTMDEQKVTREREIREILERIGYEGNDAFQPDRFVCKSGVILRTMKVKMTLIRDAWRQLRKPQIPRQFIEDLGRVEENPNDPAYKSEMQDYELARSDITTNAYYMLGTLIRFVPEGLPNVDDPEWEEIPKLLGIEVPESGKQRYVAWLKYVAIEDIQEQLDLQKNIMRMSGLVLEEDAQEAEDSFPSN